VTERYDRDWFFVAIVVLSVCKAALTRYLALGSVQAIPGLLLEVFLIIVFLGLIDLIPANRKAGVDLLAYSLLSLIMLANVLYTSYFDALVDPTTLQAVGQIPSLLGVVLDLLSPVHLLYVIDIPILALWARNLTVPGRLHPGRSKGVMAAVATCMVFAGVQVAVVAAIPAETDGAAVAKARGFGAYQVASVFRLAGVAGAMPAGDRGSGLYGTDAEQMQQRIERIRRAEDGTRMEGVEFGQYAGKNVIMIQVEAYQAVAFGATLRGQEITPNMNRMAADSWLFSNAYSQTGAGNTADAEFTVNTSLLPPMGKAAPVVYADKQLSSLPRVLKAEGYRSITFHANDADYWNRKNLYPALGFDEYYDAKKLGTGDKIWRGSSDERFFDKATEALVGELDTGKPVYAQFVTLSSHAPFTQIPRNRRPLKIPAEYKGSYAADWLSAMSYTDMAVGQFLDYLKMTGLYDESIVILYGDHVAMKDVKLSGADKEIIRGILGKDYAETDLQWVPLMIHLPGQTDPEVVTSTAGHVDIMPTVADLLGVDLSDTPHIGRSLFVDSNPLVITRSYYPGGSFFNNDVLFMPQLSFEDGTALSINDGVKVKPTKTEQADYERARQLSALCAEWVESLPERSGARKRAMGYIPVPSQRPRGDQ